MNKNVTLLGMAVTASLMLASCSNDELKDVYKGEKLSFSTKIATRAIETTSANLDSFYIYADAPGFPMFINGGMAKKDVSSSDASFTIKDEEGNDYLWPSGVDKIRFWAYGPGSIDETVISPNITANIQELGPFTPEESTTEGGEKQKDLIVAYTEVDHNNANGNKINLPFYHALSQIRINATCPSSHRRVHIKGAWLMNINKGATLSFDENAGNENHNMKWTFPEEVETTQYGITFDNPIKLGTSKAALIGKVKDTEDNKTSLMLIPQSKQGWNSSDKPQGVYLLLLCRVEAIHEGEQHSGDDSSDSNDGVHSENGKHYHQLFPVSEKWNEQEYGYTCVTFDINWQPNKTYVYNLQICGNNSGAGVYPPQLPDGLNPGDVTIVERPTGKNPGDAVLDNPITFTVTLNDWTGGSDSNTNMK